MSFSPCKRRRDTVLFLLLRFRHRRPYPFSAFFHLMPLSSSPVFDSWIQQFTSQHLVALSSMKPPSHTPHLLSNQQRLQFNLLFSVLFMLPSQHLQPFFCFKSSRLYLIYDSTFRLPSIGLRHLTVTSSSPLISLFTDLCLHRYNSLDVLLLLCSYFAYS
ncbi:unnamed protein product [Vicia faba]|uniref:Uncharacterized protein n=1 Tax=Vicia faba TaxID=3906 RepID=A0AAV0YR25_VICFA|nr:unnamed protein product [Vicia faba]